MKNLRKAIEDLALKLYVKATALKDSTVEAVTNTDGDAYIDTVVKILIAVVVGALLLWGLYELMGDSDSGIMGALTQKIEELFDRVDTSGR